MKKSSAIIVFLLAISLFQQIPLAEAVCDAGDSSCILAEQFGLNQTQIPENKEDISQLYLKMRWTEVIEKNRVLGPIHRFFTKISWLFIILFHHPYEFSLTLFVIIILWFLFGTIIAKLIEALSGMKGTYAFCLGIIATILLSLIGFTGLVATSILDLIFKQENWWMRLIIILFVIIVVALVYRTTKYAEKYTKEQNKNKLAQKQEAQVKKIEKLEQGAGI